MCVLLIGVVLLAVPDVAMADSAPLTSQQNITDSLSIEANTIITQTTSSGAMWAIERRFTYGEIATCTMLMAVCMIMAFDIILRLALQRP